MSFSDSLCSKAMLVLGSVYVFKVDGTCCFSCGKKNILDQWLMAV